MIASEHSNTKLCRSGHWRTERATIRDGTARAAYAHAGLGGLRLGALPKHRRSIYRFVWRGLPNPFMETLAFPDLDILA